MHAPRRLLTLTGLLLALVLGACEGPAPQRPTPPPQDLAAQAEAAVARGDLAAAADLFQRAASTATEPRRSELLLLAARLYLEQGQAQAAETALGQVSPAALAPVQRYQRGLLQARLLVQQGKPDAAAAAIDALGPPPAELRPAALRLQAELLAAREQPLAAAQARAELDPLLTDPQAQAENRRALWALLEQVPLETLRARMPPPPDEFGGWLELAFLTRTHRLDLAALRRELQLWQGRYPNHAAAAQLVPELLAGYQSQIREAKRLAVLLPLSGPLAAPGQAVLDGFLAAYYAGAGEKPQVRVYDVGGGENVLSLYQQALNDGAELVVGPLAKESLTMLAASGHLPVPVLALNTLPGGQAPAPNLFQFGLAPEDDAVAAADYALSQGHRRAVVLVPVGEWGERVGQAFAEAFTAGGGEVLETAAYDAQTNDFSEPIQSVLNLDAAERRYRQLRNLLRRDLKFEPRRREDVDVVFMGAYPKQGRLLRPQLKFFRAIDLPALATSHVFTGKVDPAADQDLDGVEFVDLPWLLYSDPASPFAREALKQSHASAVDFPRLFAFGVDAYRLTPYLDTLRAAPGQAVEGLTGRLHLDAQGRVHRQLYPARFKGGQPTTAGLPAQPFGHGAR